MAVAYTLGLASVTHSMVTAASNGCCLYLGTGLCYALYGDLRVQRSPDQLIRDVHHGRNCKLK